MRTWFFHMVKVNFILFGYRRIRVKSEDVKATASLFLNAAITCDCNGGEFLIAERDALRASQALDGKIEYVISEALGIPGKFKRIRYKYGLFVGILISCVMIFFTSNLVWDIRIDGNESISDTEIREILSECGLEIGSSWFSLNRGRVETAVLDHGDKLSWININRRGTVAYIEVIENTLHQGGEVPKHTGYANIVATESCVIEEITVKCGTAAVKPGDAVKKGDVLISGIMPSGEFCYADGSVIGRLSDTVEINVSRKYERREMCAEEVIESTIKLFKLNINILKKYGNSYDSCDIIEDIKVFSLFGGAPLPICIVNKTAQSYKIIQDEYSDEELVSVASSRLRALTTAELIGSDLLRIRTSGEFTHEGYVMRSDIVFLSQIGKALEFKVN